MFTASKYKYFDFKSQVSIKNISVFKINSYKDKSCINFSPFDFVRYLFSGKFTGISGLAVQNFDESMDVFYRHISLHWLRGGADVSAVTAQFYDVWSQCWVPLRGNIQIFLFKK